MTGSYNIQIGIDPGRIELLESIREKIMWDIDTLRDLMSQSDESSKSYISGYKKAADRYLKSINKMIDDEVARTKEKAGQNMTDTPN